MVNTVNTVPAQHQRVYALYIQSMVQPHRAASMAVDPGCKKSFLIVRMSKCLTSSKAKQNKEKKRLSGRENLDWSINTDWRINWYTTCFLKTVSTTLLQHC